MSATSPVAGLRIGGRSAFWIGGVLLLSLAALALSMVHVLRNTAAQFDRAAASQTQLADVSRIEALAFDKDTRGLKLALDRYIESIGAETRLLGDPDGQHDELALAERLRSVAGNPVQRDTMRALVARIGGRERAEAAAVSAHMARLRARMAGLTALLTLLAMGSAILGAAGLIAANRRLADQVTARTADLAAIDRSRRLFFAKASHEMRTPVTVMRGEAEIALADPDPAQWQAALGHVVANAEFLEHRIEELLGLARAEDGRFALERTGIDLMRVVADASDAAHGYARSNDIRIHVDAPGEPLGVTGDARWLGQALLAALDNAVKFSRPGDEVRLAVRRSGDDALIEIADRGIGIVPDALPRVFDAYYQADGGQSRGGTGLGLALARWVVEQHDGTICAANDPAGGCTITIALPLTTREAA